MAEERSSTAYAVDQNDEQSGYEPPQSPKHHKKETKRYVAFRSDDDESSEFEVEDTPRKDRKKLKKDRSNTFKEKFKSIKVKKRDKENKDKLKEKEKEKEEKKEKKEKKKHKRSLSAGAALTPAHVQSPPPAKPVFGVKLELAVARSKLADGIELPTIFRQCIHYLEENGLDQEGLYRVSGVKSKIDELKYLFDHETKIDFDADDVDPNIVAGLLKQYLRELPENLLTQTLQPVFDAIVGLRDEQEQVEKMRYLLGELPKPNYTLLSWLFVHLDHVMKNSSQTKMSIQSISIVFSPTMNISHGVLYIILTNVDAIFPNVKILKYIEPVEVEPKAVQPKSPRSLAEELKKQEVFLDNLYDQMKKEGTNEEEVMEQMWEVQRTVTQLKRKLKTIRRGELGRSATEDCSSVKKPVEGKMDELEAEQSEAQAPGGQEEVETEAKSVKKETKQTSDEHLAREPKKRLVEIAKQTEESSDEASRRQKRNEEHSRILEECKGVKTPKNEVEDVKVEDVKVEDVKVEDVKVEDVKEPSSQKEDDANEKEDEVDWKEVDVAEEPPVNEVLADDEEEEEEEEDEEMAALLREELRLRIEQEELLTLSARLKERIQRELNDVSRLRMQVDEFKRKEDRAPPVSSSDEDSSEENSDSESGTDSDSDNSELENILKELQKENEKLENQTVDLVKALVEENDKCVKLKVELRLIEACNG